MQIPQIIMIKVAHSKTFCEVSICLKKTRNKNLQVKCKYPKPISKLIFRTYKIILYTV